MVSITKINNRHKLNYYSSERYKEGDGLDRNLRNFLRNNFMKSCTHFSDK